MEQSAPEVSFMTTGSIMGCCVANASLGLAFAREGALRCQGDTAQINLLVNRTSRLADVDSYLLVDDLKPGDEIVLSFTVPKSTASYTATTGSGAKSASTPSRCAEHHRIGIAKPNEPRDTPIYRRAHLRSDQAPMVWVERFVPERELRSW